MRASAAQHVRDVIRWLRWWYTEGSEKKKMVSMWRRQQ